MFVLEVLYDFETTKVDCSCQSNGLGRFLPHKCLERSDNTDKDTISRKEIIAIGSRGWINASVPTSAHIMCAFFVSIISGGEINQITINAKSQCISNNSQQSSNIFSYPTVLKVVQLNTNESVKIFAISPSPIVFPALVIHSG